MADYSDLKNKFKTDDIPTGDDYGQLISLAGDAKDRADSSVPDNGDGSITINNKKIIPASKDAVVSDNKDNTITVNGKTYVPVADNQNGTITVNTQTYVPADASKVAYASSFDGTDSINQGSISSTQQLSDLQNGTYGFGQTDTEWPDGPEELKGLPRWGSINQWTQGGPTFQKIYTNQNEEYWRQKSGAPAQWGEWNKNAKKSDIDNHPFRAIVSSFSGANLSHLDLYWTNDYETFHPINKSIPNNTGVLRDPSISYFDNRFWIAYTWGVYYSYDLIDYTPVNLPVIKQGVSNWAPEWVIDGNNVYLLATAGSYEIWGSRADYKGYWCQFDPVSMTFTAWSTLDYTNPTGIATNIDNTMVKFNGSWWLAMKDEYHYIQPDYAPKIQLYRGANVTGHFDYVTDIPFTQPCEGPSLVVVDNQLYCFADGFASYSAWRMSSLDGTTWTNEVEVKASDRSRTQHFTVLPLSDTTATSMVQQAVTYYLPETAGSGIASLRTSAPHMPLHDGVNDLYPIQGVEYYYYVPGGQTGPVTALVNLHMDYNRGYSQIHFCIEEGTQPSTIQFNHNSAFVPPYGGDNWQLCTPNHIVTLMTAGSDDGWQNDSAGPYQIIGGTTKSDIEKIKMGFLTDSFGIYVGGIKQNYIDYLNNDLSRHSCKVEAIRDNVGSTRLTQASDRSDSFCERIGKFQPDLDYLLIQGGTNDWGASMPLGTLGDTATTSFYGAVDYLIKQSFTKLPTTQLVFLTPTYRGDMASDKNAKNGQGATQTDYIKAIKDVCAKYNVQYIELGAITGIYPWINGSSLTVDGLHPNQIGHQRIARAIVSHLGL